MKMSLSVFFIVSVSTIFKHNFKSIVDKRKKVKYLLRNETHSDLFKYHVSIPSWFSSIIANQSSKKKEKVKIFPKIKHILIYSRITYIVFICIYDSGTNNGFGNVH